MITYDNFYLNTFGIFKACNVPRKKSDFVSLNNSRYNKKTSSRYWYGKDKRGEFIIRQSNRWSEIMNSIKPGLIGECINIGSCKWLLKNRSNIYYHVQCGKIYLNQFKIIED